MAKMKRKRVENNNTLDEHNSTIDSTYSAPVTRKQRRTKKQIPSDEAAAGCLSKMSLDEDIKLNIHYDFGTSKAAMSWAQVSEGSRDPSKVHIQDILVDDNTFRIPSLVAIVPDPEQPEQKQARLCFGNDVEQGLQIRAIEKKYVWTRIKQSCVFVNLDNNSERVSRAQKEDLKMVQDAHQETLGIVKKFDRVMANFDWEKEDEEVSLRSMEDVVQCFLKYLLLKTKIRLSAVLALSKIKFEQLFHNSWNIGIAVPDLWSPETRNILYSLLTTTNNRLQSPENRLDVGFPQRCQITSESKSAAAMLLKIRLEKALNMPKTERDDKLGRMQNTAFVNVDIGAGTVDISTLRLHIVGFNDAEDRTQITSKLVSVIDSRSCRDGGDIVNETMMRYLKKILRPKLRDIKSTVLDEDMSDDDFMDYFALGIERAKKGFGDNRSSVYRRIAYSGPRKLPELKVHLTFPFDSEFVRVSGTTVDVPDSLWQQCFDNQIEELLRPNGILDEHIDNTRKAVTNFHIEMMLSGGGSQAPYIHHRFRKRFAQDDIPVALPELHGQSLVAKGGVLALMDPDLCKQHLALESYGVAIADEYDESNPVHRRRENEKEKPQFPHVKATLPNSICWLTKIGDLSNDELRTVKWGYSIDLGKIRHPRDFPGRYDLKLSIYKTNNKQIGSRNGWNVKKQLKRSTIVEIGELCVPINKSRAKKIGIEDTEKDGGFIQTVDGRWVLDFDIRLTHFWSGMIHKFKVEIPERGVFEYGGMIFEEEVHLQGRTIHGAFVGDHNEEMAN